MPKLPSFTYHPDPLATGSIAPSRRKCKCCGHHRGYIYTTSPYSIHHGLENAICPWCIKSGAAHRKWKAEFTDSRFVGNYGYGEPVAARIVNEVAYRTPGFAAFQSEHWLTHCGDAMAFLGPFGRDGLASFGARVIARIRKESGLSGKEWDHYFQHMDRDHGPTAYLFRCLHCGRVDGYSDCA